MTGMDITHSISPVPSHPKSGNRKEISEITSAMGGALFGVSLAGQLSGGMLVGVALLAVFGGIGWYAARRVNQSRN